MTRALKVVVFTVLCPGLLLGQFAPHPGKPAVEATPFAPELVRNLEALRDAALASDYAYGQLAYLTENIGPRPTGSAQADAAARYVADAMRAALQSDPTELQRMGEAGAQRVAERHSAAIEAARLLELIELQDRVAVGPKVHP